MTTMQIDPTAALTEHFGFAHFMDGQEEAIRACLDGEDVVLVMPTGSGKSLCYQLTSMLMEGVTLVISPLIALMKDQVDGLKARGLPATFINSTLTNDQMKERVQGMAEGRYKLVYVAPERFRIRSFMKHLEETRVSLIAVDEAHCISQWGHDFRPDYLRLRRVVDAFPDARIMALTATATVDVQTDMVKQLGLGEGAREDPEVMVHGFSRPNLHLTVSRTDTHDQKALCITKLLEEHRTGLVYCATRRQTEEAHAMILPAAPKSAFYHAGLSDEERKATQDRFMSGELDVVVATNAFGMGVDRADLRFVVHWDIPGSMEAYYQEIGRAGRDGDPARCELLFNYADVRTQEFFLEGANPARHEILAIWDGVRSVCAKGAVTQSMTAWKDQLGVTRNEFAVRTTMMILERAGLIQREIEAGQRAYTTSLVPGAELTELKKQFPYLEEKRKRDEKKLSEILRYVGTRSCRHAYILNYFGEEPESPSCSACDRCAGRRPAGPRRPPTDEEWVVLQKILSCVARMKGRFGRGRLVQVLRGSKDAELLKRGLDNLSTYGLLADRSSGYIQQLIEELLHDRCLEITGDEYPLIEISERGRQVMQRDLPVELFWPEEKKRKKKERKSMPDSEPATYDEVLFEKLKQWRLEAAREEGVPPYVILHDKTARRLAASPPASLEEMQAIKGFGPAKVEKYGDAILRVLECGGSTPLSHSAEGQP